MGKFLLNAKQILGKKAAGYLAKMTLFADFGGEFDERAFGFASILGVFCCAQ